MESMITSYKDTAILAEWGLQPENVYQTAGYLKADALSSGGEPYIFLYAEGDVRAAIPFLKKAIPYTIAKDKRLFDATGPYGYAGIAGVRKDAHVVPGILAAFIAMAREERIISCFLRLHPITHAFTIPAAQGVQQVMHGKTVAIDLQKSVQAIRNNFSTNHKRDIKKLQAEGFQVHINRWEEYVAFQKAYRQTMELRNARAHYFFSDAYFDQLRDAELHMQLFTAHAPDGTVASATLFFANGDIVEYHLGGTMQEARHAAASKLIFDAAIPHFQRSGAKYLHIGGGYGSAEDSLFRFKSGFSRDLFTYSTIRLICDQDVYAQLSRKKETEAGEKLAADFFPLYRS